MLSTTRSNAWRHSGGGSSRSAATYSTAESGKRRCVARIAVGEMSKATVWKPRPAKYSASSPRPEPTTSARFPSPRRPRA